MLPPALPDQTFLTRFMARRLQALLSRGRSCLKDTEPRSCPRQRPQRRCLGVSREVTTLQTSSSATLCPSCHHYCSMTLTLFLSSFRICFRVPLVFIGLTIALLKTYCFLPKALDLLETSGIKGQDGPNSISASRVFPVCLHTCDFYHQAPSLLPH